jgi:ribosome-associated toxin RatA of RatAB toxin-antitoxin module
LNPSKSLRHVTQTLLFQRISAMRTVNKSALVPYAAESMYALVNDVAHYPEFLPWCRTASILSQSDTEMRASLELARGGFHKTFTTRNSMQPGRSIVITLEDGPFHHLEGRWQFADLGPAGSKVSLDMEFEFAGALLDLMAGPVFHEICNSLVSAFTHRAADGYGKR